MKDIKYFFEYIKDKEVPFLKKGLILGSFLYFILPIDIVPDFIFAMGWLDDAAVAVFIWNAVKTEIGEYVSKRKIIDSKVISLEEKRKHK
ncbi:MAG: hypothetical protein A2Y23_11505 [Clostridiales bacterium GWB2_37_7]|nr:MAG: hypothetical protein A2Y23_11505 [Clostridiales bacterium GWB2_37_7]